jgi:hypothetical protein
MQFNKTLHLGLSTFAMTVFYINANKHKAFFKFTKAIVNNRMEAKREESVRDNASKSN